MRVRFEPAAMAERLPLSIARPGAGTWVPIATNGDHEVEAERPQPCGGWLLTPIKGRALARR
jgi:hypothetical protein